MRIKHLQYHKQMYLFHFGILIKEKFIANERISMTLRHIGIDLITLQKKKKKLQVPNTYHTDKCSNFLR